MNTNNNVIGVGCDALLGSFESGRRENDEFVIRWGYTLTADHMTSGFGWTRLTEKSTGEEHSGPKMTLWEIFRGTKTLEDLYA